jgi:hypothetical protein
VANELPADERNQEVLRGNDQEGRDTRETCTERNRGDHDQLEDPKRERQRCPAPGPHRGTQCGDPKQDQPKVGEQHTDAEHGAGCTGTPRVGRSIRDKREHELPGNREDEPRDGEPGADARSTTRLRDSRPNQGDDPSVISACVTAKKICPSRKSRGERG